MKLKKDALVSVDNEWNVDYIEKAWDVIEGYGKRYGWSGYIPQFEIVSYDQMIEAYSHHALPVHYHHWSLGKHYCNDLNHYKKGQTGLAYEMIANTSPAVTYLMENNSACMQLIVLAHAAVGHNHFFKNNFAFKSGFPASYIVDYQIYAKKFIKKCESKYGEHEVEEFIDACHAVAQFSIDKYKRRDFDIQYEIQRLKDRIEYEESTLDSVTMSTITNEKDRKESSISRAAYIIDALEENDTAASVKFKKMVDGDENILRFCEDHNIALTKWQIEICRIVRNTSQYFYPNYQTKLINEGFASFAHYTLMNNLYDDNLINDGYMFEFIASHSGVIHQPTYNKKYYSGINVYKLGFSIFSDIKRICEKPTEEDKFWFPFLMGRDWVEVINDVVENYKDETFVMQFLSPKVARDLGLFSIHAGSVQMGKYSTERIFDVTATTANEDFKILRKNLAFQYSLENYFPPIEISGTEEGIFIKQMSGTPISRESVQDVLNHCVYKLFRTGQFISFTDSKGNITAEHI